MKKTIIILGGIVILILIGIFYVRSTGRVVSSIEQDEFVQYLTQQGVKMYGTDWCGYCKDQKKLFGDSFQYVDYVNCDKDRQECSDAGIRGYPTWKINGQSYSGLQSLEKLAQLSGYDGEL